MKLVVACAGYRRLVPDERVREGDLAYDIYRMRWEEPFMKGERGAADEFPYTTALRKADS